MGYLSVVRRPCRNDLRTYWADFFQISIVASPGPYPQTFFEFVQQVQQKSSKEAVGWHSFGTPIYRHVHFFMIPKDNKTGHPTSKPHQQLFNLSAFIANQQFSIKHVSMHLNEYAEDLIQRRAVSFDFISEGYSLRLFRRFVAFI